MGLFRRGDSDAARLTAKADKWSREARDEAGKAAAARKTLASGASSDPGADRAAVRRHEENQRIAAANARDFRDMARRRR